MKQTAYESVLEVRHKFPHLSKALKSYEQHKKKEEDKVLHNSKYQLLVDILNLILSIWKANPDIKVDSDGIEIMFSQYIDDYPPRYVSLYPDLSMIRDKDTRYYIASQLPNHDDERIFVPLQNFTKSELISLDNDIIIDIFRYLLSVDEVIPFLEWLFDDDTDRIRDIVPRLVRRVMAHSRNNDSVAVENFINALFNEKYYNESYIIKHHSVIVDMLDSFDRELHIKDAFKLHNPYLVHAFFTADMYSDIFNSKSHNGYTENQIKFFSVLYACNVYNGGGRVSTHGSIPKYMRHKNHLGDLYQPLKSMLDSGYNFAQIYDRIKHRFADIF